MAPIATADGPPHPALRATFSHGGEKVPTEDPRLDGLLPSVGEGARRADEGGYQLLTASSD
jgi:hypothetical protein